ncbi:MAG TPA: membrane-bound O-acyltransferase family protein, partial [Lachnospiraceae bacterium]|nr:membrane-bound O-acyltransferase family protein [Lachnospiraceae bacterium]
LMLMVWGLFQKMVIADRVAILVDTVFDNYFMYGTVALAAGALGFALQIYCDFASYSAIAMGAARVMGFELMENFNTPYFAVSVRDFWRRWHISLS